MTCLTATVSRAHRYVAKIALRRSMSSDDLVGDNPVTLETLRVASPRDWWSSCTGGDGDTSTSTKLSLLDLRSSDSYEKRRLEHSKLQVVPFPVKNLKERSFELPARHVEFSVLVEELHVNDALNFLLGSKYSTRKRPGKPWKVTNILVDEPNLWEEAADLGLFANDSSSSTVNAKFPLPRLWQPDPMVEKVLLHHLKKRQSQNESLQIWDLASGAGRDVAFLAEELLASGNAYQVRGFDHRYNEKETNITQGFWERRGVGDLTKCIQMDLSNWESVTSSLSTDNVAAIFCVRFWMPELVSDIAKCPQLRPGTLVGLSHFCRPYDGAPWNFDHPSEKTVLERTQLSELFSSHQFEILHDEIALDSDHGRTMIQFVAKKQ